MAFELPPLPYPKNALEPHISERTMDFHHGRHHQAYVTNLNNLVKGSPMESQSLEDLIKAAVNQGMTKARQQVAEETTKLTAGLGLALPPGMNLPGLS